MNWNKFNARWGKNIAPALSFTSLICEYIYFRDKQVRRNTFFQRENPFKPLFYSYEDEPVFSFGGGVFCLFFLGNRTAELYR